MNVSMNKARISLDNKRSKSNPNRGMLFAH